jgi:hypothetical protein
MPTIPKLRLLAAVLALGALSACADATSPEASLDAGTKSIITSPTTSPAATASDACAEGQGWTNRTTSCVAPE